MGRLCECGCGQETRIAPQSHTKLGWVKGEPIRFVRGHSGHLARQGRGVWQLKRYQVEDRGYGTPCWIWQGPLNNKGYGRFDFIGEHFAHRAFYRYHRGQIPEGMTLDHLCRQKTCVNPEHVEPVTAVENHARWARGLAA